MGAEVIGSAALCHGASRRSGFVSLDSPSAAPRTTTAGFTLIELVVTLFLIALVAALATPAIGRSTDALRVRAEVSGVSAFLRRAREGAIVKREVRVVTVDADQRMITDATAENEVRGRRRLPERLTVEADPPTALSIKFSPEGLSNGWRLRLLMAGGVAYRLTVDPITGRVSSRREETP